MFSSNTSQVSSSAANYIEDVFSTWLYTGNGNATPRTISNGLDFSTKGGAAFIKNRSAVGDCVVTDTVRGARNPLFTPQTARQDNNVDYAVNSFLSNGFTLATTDSLLNTNGSNYVAWSFLEQPKFFDVVTYTGNGTAGRTVAHNLGSVPGCIIVKATSRSGDSWTVYHRSAAKAGFTARESYLILNSTQQVEGPYSGYWNNTDPTDTVFTLGNDGWVNANGVSYVAYLFAHNAGGFGLTGTDNVISCGSFTASSGAATVDLGYEPQWILFKRTNGVGGWYLTDNMRGWSYSATAALLANTSDAEDPNALIANPTATGFQFGTGTLVSSGAYIYIAIRRGPMRTPTTGTSVFTPFYFAGDSSTSRQLSSGFPADTFLGKRAIGDVSPFVDRLRGKDLLLYTPSTSAEETSSLYCRFDSNSGPIVGWNAAAGVNINGTSWDYRAYAYRRAPSFHDVVCYTGTGSATARTHNLTVSPELIILKGRNQTAGVAVNWGVWSANLGTGNVFLNATNSYSTSFINMAVTATTFTDSLADQNWNQSGFTYVAYLFASCPGVSKVGSYTGTGSTQVINCGFTGGARFVMIKRTDSTGGWYVWDTARGIVSGNDPYFLLNSSDGEITNTDFIDTASTGFEISSTAPAAINASGGTFIFLAIA